MQSIIWKFAAIIIVFSSMSVAAEIQVQPRGLVPGSVVLLGDVSRITGTDTIEVEQLKRLELFPAPTLGSARMVRRSEIRELLLLNEVDLNQHQLTGASTARIISRRKRIAEKAKPLPKAPEGVQSLVVAARPLSRGETLREADVVLEPLPVKSSRRPYVRRIADVVGMELKTSVVAGRPVESTMLRRPLLVKQNDIIRVEARASGVRASTEARATESGSQGDLVVLQSLGSRERFTARVTGPGQAEVFASGITVPRPARPPRELGNRRLSARRINP